MPDGLLRAPAGLAARPVPSRDNGTVPEPEAFAPNTVELPLAEESANVAPEATVTPDELPNAVAFESANVPETTDVTP